MRVIALGTIKSFLARPGVEDARAREHLRVTGPGSYAKHMALGAFYPAIVELADKLADSGHAAAALHGDMNQSQRNRTLSRMRSGNVRVLVATDVAAVTTAWACA